MNKHIKSIVTLIFIISCQTAFVMDSESGISFRAVNGGDYNYIWGLMLNKDNPETGRFAWGPELNSDEINNLNTFMNRKKLQASCNLPGSWTGIKGFYIVERNNRPIGQVTIMDLKTPFDEDETGNNIQLNLTIEQDYWNQEYGVNIMQEAIEMLRQEGKLDGYDALYINANQADETRKEIIAELGAEYLGDKELPRASFVDKRYPLSYFKYSLNLE